MSPTSLVVGELTAYLTVDNDQYKRGLRDAKGDLTRFGAEAGRDADRIGRDTGGKLAQGTRQAIVRNSPLIVAAVGGALAAGAPVAIAGAATLFGGIAGVAAAQHLQVRTAWTALGRDIRDGMVEDAAVIVPVAVGMADKIGASYDRMRPLIRDAFEAAGPQIDGFTDSVIYAGEAVTGSLVRAVQQGAPVMTGFGDFVESTGDGLEEFFDNITGHAPAAGSAFSQLGDSVGILLPLTGEFLGQGAELAANVLPMLNGSLGLVLGVTKALGPALPPIVTALLAMKVAQAAAGWLTALGVGMETLSRRTGIAESGATRLSSTLSRVGSALPVVGAAVIGVNEAFNAQDRATSELTTRLGAAWQTINEGGVAADEASARMDAMREHFITAGEGPDAVREAFLAAEEANRVYLASLSPIERANLDLKAAENDLAAALNDTSATTGEVEGAKRRYAAAAAEQERQEGLLEQAIDGVTSAMIEQADQAMASIDSNFARLRANQRLEEAETRLNELMKEGTASSEDLQGAQLDVAEATYRAAEAYGQQQADLSGLDRDSAEYARTIQTQTLTQLYRLRDVAGPGIRGSIQQQIDALQAGGLALDRGATKANGYTGALQNLGRQRPQPVATLNDGPFTSIFGYVGRRVSELHARRATPTAILQASTAYAESLLNYAARNRTSYVTQVVQQSFIGGWLSAAGGKVGQTPVIGYDGGGKVRGPGGPRDDMVRVRGPLPDVDYRLSNTEWIVQAAAAARYGDRKMQAVNSGRAIVMLPEEMPRVRGLAGGGSVGGASFSRDAERSAAANLHVHFHGPVLADRRALRKTAVMLDQELTALRRANG